MLGELAAGGDHASATSLLPSLSDVALMALDDAAGDNSASSIWQQKTLSMDQLLCALQGIDSALEVRLITKVSDIGECVQHVMSRGDRLGRTVFVVNSTNGTSAESAGVHYSALLADADGVDYYEPAQNAGMRTRNQELLIRLRNILHTVALFSSSPLRIEPHVIPCTMRALEPLRVANRAL